ncbi:MAG: acetyl-CoA carboxylase biotin carboxyl carrier protein [Geminicoccaceae bacterium]
MPKVDIDTAYIETLAELLARTGLTEIEICQGDTRIRVAKKIPATVEYVQQPSRAAAVAPPAAAVAAPVVSEAGHPGTITSPMVGTAYLLPEPGAAPFVKTGDMVKEGQTLLIIEAMKVMNAIRAPRAGQVTRIFATNAAPVEYGEPLMIVE